MRPERRLPTQLHAGPRHGVPDREPARHVRLGGAVPRAGAVAGEHDHERQLAEVRRRVVALAVVRGERITFGWRTSASSGGRAPPPTMARGRETPDPACRERVAVAWTRLRGVPMPFRIRKPSLGRMISARLSPARFIRHNLGLKAPRGFGWFTNPKRALQNRIYYRTTISVWDLLRRLFGTRR